MKDNQESNRKFLRHALATLAYRGQKAISNIPEGFAEFRIGDQTRTPGEILAHVNDVLEWGIRLARGEKGGLNSTPMNWKDEAERFFSYLEDFDTLLASDEEIKTTAEKLFQGPIADSFTHIGQIALLRRLAGKPVRGENYFKADIVYGRTGQEQSEIRFEFD